MTALCRSGDIVVFNIIITGTEAVAFFLGTVIEGHSVYVLSLPCVILFTYLNGYLGNKFFGQKAEILSNFFTLQRPFINGMDMDYPGPRIDLFLLSKLLYIIAFALLILGILWLISSRQNKLPAGAVVLGMFGVAFFSVCFWATLYPEHYSYDQKLYVTEFEPQNWKITYYKGIINLSEYTTVECEIGVLPTEGKGDAITLRLDKQFEIIEIKADGAPCNYEKSEDYITVQIPTSMEKKMISLHFSYRGRIFYVSDISTINIYTSWFSAALPTNFAFIPILDGDNGRKDYYLTVLGRNSIISNLEVTEGGDGKTFLHGKATGACIFMGYFDYEVKDGTELYHAKYNNLTNYWLELEKAQARTCLNPRTFEFYEQTGILPQKVFIIYYLYGVLGVPVVFDDCVMINYGYASSR